MPLFSIIIPIYNLESYIRDTLSSISAQTFPDYEVVIVDDGSTDSSAEVCRDWCEHHSRFSLIRKENGGVSSARNLGIKEARGQYIWFIDGDDFIHPNSLKCLKTIFEKYPEADYVSFKYSYVKQTYKQFPFPELNTEQLKLYSGTSQKDFERMIGQTPYAACCICIRRESIGNLRFLPICTSEDAFFALQLTYQAHNAVVWNESPYYYYQRLGSFVNSTYSWRKFKDFMTFIEHIGNMKGEKKGWGDGYLAFLQYRSALPFLCRHVRFLPTRQERQKGRVESRRLIDEHCRIFKLETTWYMRLIHHTRSRFLAWVFLVLRYDVRDWVLHSQYMTRMWKWIKA